MTITEQLRTLNQAKNNLAENNRKIITFSDGSTCELHYDTGIKVTITTH